MKNDRLIEFSDLPASFDRNRALTAEKRVFAAKVAAAVAVTEEGVKDMNGKPVFRLKREKLSDLDAIVAEGTDKLDSGQIMMLFSAYRDLAAFNKMIDLYKSVENEDFKNAPMVREQLAVAYRKMLRGEKLADKMWDYHQSMDLCFELINEGRATGVAYENIGRCLRYIAQKTEMTDKTAQRKRQKELFEDSTRRLEEGFMGTLESSIGMQAVHNNIALGNTDRARETSKVVYLAALRDGAEESSDYFCVSAALQAACISGQDKRVVDHLCNRLENSIRYRWELEDVYRDMSHISEAFKTTEIADVCERLSGLCATAFPKGRKTDAIAFSNRSPKNDRYITDDPKLQAVRDYSYSYRGCGSNFRGTNRIGGNMAFGGQLPDHCVSRKDLKLFTQLVKMTPEQLGVKLDKPVGIIPPDMLMKTPLTDIRDPEVFMTVADAFIRRTFTTENFAGCGLHMEDNALQKNENGESRYDATVKSVLRSCGKKIGQKDANIDTRTNISAIFALGMGDCRHHAQVKQIMFDMWQKQQMNGLLSDMYYQAWQGKTVDDKNWQVQEFYNILDTELRTADVEVRTPVLMEQTTWTDGNGVRKTGDAPYKPLMRDGKFVPDPNKYPHSLEEHTLCWLIHKDREGHLIKFGLRDAFYQDKHYDWGHKDVDVRGIRVSMNGKPLIPAGKIDGAKTTTGESLVVCQSPTVYNSGKRDSFVKGSVGRDVCLVGVPMAGFETAQDFLKMIKDRKGMARIMEKVLLKDPETKGWKAEIARRRVADAQKRGGRDG